MRFRVLAIGLAWLAVAAPARALNPQSAGLQVALRAQGLYLGPIDALVGPKTVQAVRAFQRQEHLAATGRADPRTRAALGPFGRPLFGTRTLRRGMFGWDVSVLQFLLARAGLGAPVNGYFDAPTTHALRAYQRRLDLASDGIAGPATFSALGLQTRVPVPQERVVAVVSRTYVVKPGDSLTAIARRNGTTLSKLAKLNDVDPAKALLIGTKLTVPVSVKTARRSRTAAAATNTLAVRASIDKWAAQYGLDPQLVRALAWMESGFQQSVVSSVGAEGVMQLLPSTWQYVQDVLIGHKVGHTADGNVEVGVAYLNHLLQAFDGNEHLALAAWYQGEKAVRDQGPFPESTAFVDDVLALRTRM
jgi:LysM repeat protein